MNRSVFLALGFTWLATAIVLGDERRSRPELPPESQLPGQRISRSANWPNESVVPQRQPFAALPPESQVPVALIQPPIQKRELPPLAPRGRPWIGFNARGHVGLIRAMAFSADGERLFSGGADKAIHVWRRVGDPVRWVHERTVRWQVSRGPRGTVQALATADNQLVIAGYSAMGLQGDIWRVRSHDGSYLSTLYDRQNPDLGHRLDVNGLSFSPSGNVLASADGGGKVVIWRREEGGWQVDRAGPLVSGAKKSDGRLARVLLVDDQTVIVPWRAAGESEWSLQPIDLRTRRAGPLLAKSDHRHVVSLDRDQQGLHWVSADVGDRSGGKFIVWTRAQRGFRSVKYPTKHAITSLSMSPDGSWIVVGHQARQRSHPFGCSLYQLDRPSGRYSAVREIQLPKTVGATCFTPDSRQFAVSTGNQVFVHTTDDPNRPAEVLGLLHAGIQRVAFADEGYEFSFEHATGGKSPVQSFDPHRLRLTQRAPSPSRRAERTKVPDDVKLWAKTKLCSEVTAQVRWSHGNTAWEAYAIQDEFEIFVSRRAGDDLQLSRRLRGHTGAVRSMAVSSDGRYLLSGGDDAAVRIWPLPTERLDPTVQRWGASFEIRDDKLVVTSLQEDGPLFGAGVRRGDVISKIGWSNKLAESPAAIRDALNTADWYLMYTFIATRAGLPRPILNRHPAWEPIASFFVDPHSREWAFWSPKGYYDASFQGHKLFGWLFNSKRFDRLPSYFGADQLKGQLERPDVMRQLLEAGSIDGAFRRLAARRPEVLQDIVADAASLAPRIEVVDPPSKVEGRSGTISARIFSPQGAGLARVKAFANGVPSRVRQMSTEEVAGGTWTRFRFDFQLPHDPSVIVQVVAATDSGSASVSEVLLEHDLPATRPNRRLHLISVGVGDYRDAGIGNLDFAPRNAEQVVNVLTHTARAAFENRKSWLRKDDSVTRFRWREFTDSYANELKGQIRPDDLIVLYLSGHGLRDPDTGEFYFVTANARRDDLSRQQYQHCLSFSSLAAFGELPCRKLVVLDTCHGGAVQPNESEKLKAAVRALEDDLMLFVTASEGTEEAIETQEQRLGQFTHYLLRGLEGAADTNGDALVDLAEVVRFVKLRVAAASTDTQHPTAGPRRLLEFANPALTRLPSAG